MALSIDRLIEHRQDEHEGDDDEGTSDVVVAKAVAMVVLFFASMIFGLTPMFLSKKFKWIGEGQTAADIKSSNKIVLVLLSFGGGVLLCTTFMHLLPEVGENVRSLQDDGILGDLPFHLEALLTCAGFFAMYFVEEAVHFYLHRRAARRTSAPPDSALMRSLSIRHSRNNANNNHPEFGVKDPEKSQLPDDISTIEQTVTKANGDHHHHHHHHEHNHDHSKHGHSHGHSHMPVMEGDDDPVIASLRGLLIVLALSVHELFEGLAVGLESSAGSVWYMFGAVSAHKLVIAFCVGVELVTVKTKTSLCVVYITTFAVVSPIGIGIGIAMAGGEGAAASGLSSVILQGLASGTLLYVVFFEILQRDRAGLIQFISALVGFLVMFGLQFATGHEHDHDHSSTSAAEPASLGHGHSHSHGHGHSHSH